MAFGVVKTYNHMHLKIWAESKLLLAALAVSFHALSGQGVARLAAFGEV